MGIYEVQAIDPTIVGQNFNGAPIFVGALTVSPKAVTLNPTNVSKVYDGTTSITRINIGLTGAVSNDDLTLSGTGTFNQKNVGQGLSFAFTNLTLNGADANNYYLNGGINYLNGTNGVITPAPLTLSSTPVSKVYDGTTNANGTLQVMSGTQLFGTDAISGGTFRFTDPSIGLGNKTIQLSNVTVNDDNNGNNYAITYIDNTQSSITAAPSGAPAVPPIASTSKPFYTADDFKFRLKLGNQEASSLSPDGLAACLSESTTDCVCKSEGGDGNESSVSCSSNSKSVKSNSLIHSDG